jgi:hypothetical protein
MLSYNYSTQIVLLYWPSLSSTLLGVDSLQAMSLWSHTTSCNHPVQSIQENIVFHRADDRFSLEVLTPMESVSLSHGTWDSFSPTRVPDEVVRPGVSRDECNMIGLCNVLYHPHTEGKAMHPSSFSCAPPPFANLGTRFLLRGKGCNIPCFRNHNLSH